MKIILATVLVFGFTHFICAQNANFEWAVQMGGTNIDVGHSIKTENNGNIYTTGFFRDTVDFDPGSGTNYLSSAGWDDIFVQKLDPSGNLLWVKQIGGSLVDMGNSITIDTNGNVYITGKFQDTVDFDPGIGVTNLYAVGYDIFILKLDSSGNFKWVKQISGNTYSMNGNSISVDLNGDIYSTGYFSGTIDIDPGLGTLNFTSAGSTDIYIQKLDSAGNLIWAKQIGGTYYEGGGSILTDSSSNLYIAGSFGGVVDFNPGVGINNLYALSWSDMYILKLDSASNFIWVKQLKGNSDDIIYSIANFGNAIYTAGSFQGTTDFDPGIGTENLTSLGGNDIFIQKLDTAGNFIWVKRMGGISDEEGNSITTDINGNIYIIGNFNDTVDFNPGSGINNLTSAGYYDVFIQKLDSAGNLLWVKQMGSANNDFGLAITTSVDHKIYSTGCFSEIVDFDPGVGTTNLTSAGIKDIFIQKLSQCIPNNSIDIVTACNTYTWIDGNTYISSNNTATYTLTNTQGCDSTITLNLTIDTVNVNVTNSDPIITANANGASYQWLDCNNNYSVIIGATSKSYIATANGDYSVEVTHNSCIDTSLCIPISTVAIFENQSFNKISIYPNPTSGLTTIDLGNLKNVRIKVFTPSGKIVYKKENIQAQKFQLDLNLAKGLYFIEIRFQEEFQIYKLILN